MGRKWISSSSLANIWSLPPFTLDADTVAWIASVVANGGTVSTARQNLVDYFIVGMKANNLWTKFDRIWLLAGEDQPSALTDLVARASATAVNSPSFTADRGFTGVDASSIVYIDTNFNAFTAGGHYVLNDAHISVWSNTNTTSSAGGGDLIGATDTSKLSYIIAKYSDGNAYLECNDGTSPPTVANADSTGHYLVSRTGANISQGYRNSATLGALQVQASGAAVANCNFVLLASNDVGAGIGGGSACQVSMASIGGGLTASDVANFYSLLRTYMNTVGVS